MNFTHAHSNEWALLKCQSIHVVQRGNIMSEYQVPRKLECVHVDTCLSSFWSGHHLPHIQIPVYRGMTVKALKEELHSELDQGAVAGSNPIVQDDSGEAGDRWYKKAHAAVNRIRPAVKGTRRLFLDLEESDEDYYESVYAFFVFIEE